MSLPVGISLGKHVNQKRMARPELDTQCDALVTNAWHMCLLDLCPERGEDNLDQKRESHGCSKFYFLCSKNQIFSGSHVFLI